MKDSEFQFAEMPFVRFLFFYLMGIGAGYYFDVSRLILDYVSFFAGLSICLFFSLGIISRLENFKFYASISAFFYLFLFFFAWYSMWEGHHSLQSMHFSSRKSDALIGFIDDEPRFTRTGIKFPLKIVSSVHSGTEFKSIGNLLINIRIDSAKRNKLLELYYGDELIIPANFSLVGSPKNPHEFDYKSFLADHSIWHQVYLHSADIVQIGSKKGNALKGFALSIRQKMLKKLDYSIKDRDAFTIASALVLGYQSQISQEILDMFSVTGTIHVLSVSGLHVGIVFAVFTFLLFWMKGRKWRTIKAIVLICLIWSYALITGLSPSVLRASIMISFGIIAFSFYRKGNIYNTVAASALFLLLYNPHFISGIGFKLSYFAVLGIVYLFPKIYALFSFKSRIASAIWSSSAISIAAQIATFPLVLYYFHFFPVYFLPANVIIILPASVIVYLGFLVLIVPAGFLQFWLSWALENLILLMRWVLNLFENFPYATWDGIWIKPWQYILIYVALLGIIYFFIYKKAEASYIIMGCIFVLLLDRTYSAMSSQRKQEIRIYNVYRNLAIGFFDYNGSFIFTDSLTVESPHFQYSIAPNLNASGNPSKTTFLNQGDLFRNDNLFSHNGIIQHGNKSLLIYSGETRYTDVLFVDLLYLRNSAKVDLQELRKSIHFKKILLDGSNSDLYIKKVKESAKILRIPIYVLKNNFAYVW